MQRINKINKEIRYHNAIISKIDGFENAKYGLVVDGSVKFVFRKLDTAEKYFVR